MQQDWHDLNALRITQLILFRANLTQNNRVDGFKMRWVCGQRQVDRIAIKLTV